MKTAIRKIGNSKGVLIPAPLITACDIQEEVTMHVENKRIVIEALNTTPRKNWFANYNPEQDASVIGEIEETTIEQEDWEW